MLRVTVSEVNVPPSDRPTTIFPSAIAPQHFTRSAWWKHRRVAVKKLLSLSRSSRSNSPELSRQGEGNDSLPFRINHSLFHQNAVHIEICAISLGLISGRNIFFRRLLASAVESAQKSGAAKEYDVGILFNRENWSLPSILSIEVKVGHPQDPSTWSRGARDGWVYAAKTHLCESILYQNQKREPDGA